MKKWQKTRIIKQINSKTECCPICKHRILKPIYARENNKSKGYPFRSIGCYCSICFNIFMKIKKNFLFPGVVCIQKESYKQFIKFNDAITLINYKYDSETIDKSKVD